MQMIEALDSQLVLTKLRAPVVRPRHITRERLLNRLTPQAAFELVLVCAPAGYGKTTLLAEWAQSLRQNGAAVAWFSLDASDDDPLHFASYLVEGLCQVLGPAPELSKTARLLRASPEIDLQYILPAIINAIVASDRACGLFLDDYHLISVPAIHGALDYLLDHLPHNLRIYIGSRSSPPLPLARLRARGQLLELGAADLRFTPAETARYLNEVMQLDLQPKVIAALTQRTEGWAAGLQLAGLSLSNRPDPDRFLSSFSGSHRYLADYLLEEVFNNLSEPIQSFLLTTSILERMCAPLCDALVESREQGSESSNDSRFSALASRQTLEFLEKSNLFIIPLDDEQRWYRYHHLFRDFLQARLNLSPPERVSRLHRAACQWLAAHGCLVEAGEQAFQDARQTQDWEFAAAFVEQHCFTLIVHSEISTIYEWCSAFPEEVMLAHPILCIHQCWPWVFRFQRQYRGRVEARLRQVELAIAALPDRQQARELAEPAAVVRSFLAMAPDPAADPRAQLALAQSALGSYPEGDAGQFSTLLMMGYCYMALYDIQAAVKTLETARQIALRGRLYFGVVESTFHLARLAHARGQLRRAEEICQQGLADIAALLSHPRQELPALGCLQIELGCIYLELDRLEEAEGQLLAGYNQTGLGMNPYYQMTALVGLFGLREIQGRSPEALEYLASLEAAWPDIAFCTQALRITHTLRTAPSDPRALVEAAAWSQTFSPILEQAFPPALGPFGAAEVYYLASLAWARVQIALGQPQAALTLLEQQLTLAAANGLTQRVIECALLEVQAAQSAGDDSRTWSSLERALAAAQPEGYVRSFDQGPAAARLLAEAAQRNGPYHDYLERLLAASPISETPSPSSEGAAGAGITLEFGERLSQRELEVLRLMAGGASNQAIAVQLVITVGTVKSHINHILAKLDVHNRTEAASRARGLGLLES